MENLVLFNDLASFSSDFYDMREAAAKRVITSGWWLNGKETGAFAEEFANYLNIEFCLPLANGTDALEIAMRTITEVRGAQYDEVVTVGNAGGYSSIACRLVGLKPVYADIDSQSLLMNMDSALSCVGPRTSFVVVTHLYGGVADVKTLRKKLDGAGYQGCSYFGRLRSSTWCQTWNAESRNVGRYCNVQFLSNEKSRSNRRCWRNC